MALPKALRLRLARDIKRVFQRSAKLETNLLVAKVHYKTSPPGRATVIVPKRVSKSAVFRNRLRRRAVENIRTHLKLKSVRADIAITIKPTAAYASRRDFQSDLNLLLRRLKLRP